MITPSHDVIIIGAGAAGLMCGGVSGARGRKTLILDHSKKIAEKIRISGGGRCNFTNLHTSPENFLSQNPHFCKSALKQYTQYDFIDWVAQSGIPYHEKKLGQLFCDQSAQNIIDMLVQKCIKNSVDIQMETIINKITKDNDTYHVETNRGLYTAQSLVMACGGLSIPKIGATGFGYTIARQFGLDIVSTRAGLVPLTFQDNLLHFCKSISGLSVEANVHCNNTDFAEGLLFTHRGLSGPSILQISSYWNDGAPITVNLCPDMSVYDFLLQRREQTPKQDIQTILSDALPKRLVEMICTETKITGRIADMSNEVLKTMANAVNQWTIYPSGTEGYRTAEVTLGGVDTNQLSSKTMECKTHKGLYFIGEIVDVTGHLGGHNFQWAWSSGYVAGMNA